MPPLQYYYTGFSVLLTTDDFADLAYAYLAIAHAQSVRHAEVFFDPQAHTSRGVSYVTVIEGLSTARRRAAVDFPQLSVAFVPCLLRHLPVPSAHSMLDEIVTAGHFDDGTLIGFGMSSSEAPYPPTLFSSVYDAARAAGIQNLTAHAGEEGPPSFVSSALADLGVLRIDHGRRAAEDDALLAQLARDKTMLTLCPVSNVVLRGAARLADLPIRKFLDAGVRFSINSDDPAYFGGYILENYCAVHDAFDLSVDEWAGVAMGAVEGSWCDEARKAVLRAEVEQVVGEWRGRLAVV
ncbi:Adenine deaminase like protein [Verticillium longisporum]|nr:Adenine deaminase like protein [Verticillium longisporum]